LDLLRVEALDAGTQSGQQLILEGEEPLPFPLFSEITGRRVVNGLDPEGWKSSPIHTLVHQYTFSSTKHYLR